MTYPLYAAEWRLPTTVITEIFAIYPIVVVSVLDHLWGSLGSHWTSSDNASRPGRVIARRRVVVRAGTGRRMAVRWARADGVGVGLSAGPSTAAMVEFSAPGQSRSASSITTAAQAAGYVLAFLVGGGLIQYAPYPTYLSFLALGYRSCRAFRCDLVPASRPYQSDARIVASPDPMHTEGCAR